MKSIFHNSKQDCVVKRIHDDDLEWKKKENPGGKVCTGDANKFVFKSSNLGYRIYVVKKPKK